MEYVLRQLSSSVVLSKDDINAIRQSIAQRYGSQTKERRAVYLAQAIHRAVDKALLGIEQHLWQQLKQSLFRNTLAKQKLDITKRDVFHEIVNLDLDAETLSGSTYRWLVTQQVDGIDPGDLSQYINRHQLLQGRVALTKQEAAIKPLSKKDAGTWLAIESSEQTELKTATELSPVEELEKPLKGKIKSLEPAPHFNGPEDWPVSYRISHLGWAVIATTAIMGLSMLYTLLK